MIKRNRLHQFAVVWMFIDHLTWYFIHYPSPGYTVIHFITRISAPVFFFNAGMNIERTKDINRYLLRLFILLILSVIPFSLYQARGNITNIKFLPTSVDKALIIV